MTSLGLQLTQLITHAYKFMCDFDSRDRDHHVIRVIIEQQLGPVYLLRVGADLITNHCSILACEGLEVLQARPQVLILQLLLE